MRKSPVECRYEGLLRTKYGIHIYPCCVAYMNAMRNKSTSKYVRYKLKVSNTSKRCSVKLKDVQFLGSYALHTDPIVRGNLVSVSVGQCVSVSVCQCVTLRTRRHVTRRLLAGRLGTSNSKLFRRPLLLPSCCCMVVY